MLHRNHLLLDCQTVVGLSELPSLIYSLSHTPYLGREGFAWVNTSNILFIYGCLPSYILTGELQPHPWRSILKPYFLLMLYDLWQNTLIYQLLSLLTFMAYLTAALLTPHGPSELSVGILSHYIIQPLPLQLLFYSPALCYLRVFLL